MERSPFLIAATLVSNKLYQTVAFYTHKAILGWKFSVEVLCRLDRAARYGVGGRGGHAGRSPDPRIVEEFLR